jgi:outer membrane protein assembly factor BamD
MLKNHLKFAAVIMALFLSACGSLNTEKSDETKSWSASKLYAEAKGELNGGNYEKAIKYFEKLESRYPFGSFAQQAQMEVAYAYYRQNDQAQALAAVERFIRLHPNHPSVDYMYYLRGLANFNDKKGLFDFISNQDLTERDPKAARDAFEAFRQLIERAQTVLRDYAGSPFNQEALRIQIRSYDELGMQDLRDDAERVYALNYKNKSTAPLEASARKSWWKFW